MAADRPAQARRKQARRVYPLRALLSPDERHKFKVLAASLGVSTQELAGTAIRDYLSSPPTHDEAQRIAAGVMGRNHEGQS